MPQSDSQSIFNGRVLSVLGMARKAQGVFIGQDRVRDALRKKKSLLIITAEGLSANLEETLSRPIESGQCKRLSLVGITREQLGKSVGIHSTLLAALPLNGGFARSILSFYDGGSDANEQNQGV